MSDATTLKIFDPSLLEGHAPGTWLAFSADQERVVGSGASMDEAIEKARRSGEEHPVVFRIPPQVSALIV